MKENPSFLKSPTQLGSDYCDKSYLQPILFV